MSAFFPPNKETEVVHNYIRIRPWIVRFSDVPRVFRGYMPMVRPWEYLLFRNCLDTFLGVLWTFLMVIIMLHSGHCSWLILKCKNMYQWHCKRDGTHAHNIKINRNYFKVSRRVLKRTTTCMKIKKLHQIDYLVLKLLC